MRCAIPSPEEGWERVRLASLALINIAQTRFGVKSKIA
jgi:hypothetical protein